MAKILILCREITEDVSALWAMLAEHGHAIAVSNPESLTVQMDVNSISFWLNGQVYFPDLVFGWTSLHHRERGEWLMTAFQMAGIKVLNTAAVLGIGQNKFIASALMSKLGIPHIPTWLVGSPKHLELAITALQFPLVIKPVYGAKGQGVMLVEDAVALQQAAQPYFLANSPVYLQQRILKPNRDIRVRVINYEADFAFYRYVAEGKFISNLCQGGKFSPAKIDDALRELSERCARAFQAPVAGIDVCEDETGAYHVIEVNMTPAITWPHQATVEKVSRLILASLP